MLEMVYGESAMKCGTVYKWVDRFKEGRECVDDDTSAGRKKRSKIKTMLIVFSIFVELFIINMFQQVKLLMQNSVLKF
jgi:hypothetical protein